MKFVDFYIYLTISLTGVAYPLLLQVIARLDEKYSSTHILKLFRKEFCYRYFVCSILVTLFMIALWSFHIEPIFEIGEDSNTANIIKNSTTAMVSLSSTVLIIFFFLLIRMVLTYCTLKEIAEYLIKAHKKAHGEKKISIFSALTDIFLFTIKTQDRNVSPKLILFFAEEFKNYRAKLKNKSVEYPNEYYEAAHKALKEFTILKEKRFFTINYSEAGGDWLLDHNDESKISLLTYRWMWSNILLLLRYNEEELLFNHWEISYNYCRFKQDMPIEEKKEFWEFHYALGGLLLYDQKYSLINRFFNFTVTSPPQHYSLPDNISQVLEYYFFMIDPGNTKSALNCFIYCFHKGNSIDSDGLLRKWTSQYMALLFLRQYALNPAKASNDLILPPSQKGIRFWIDNIDSFADIVRNHLENPLLMKKLNLTFITLEWCKSKDVKSPVELLSIIKEKLHEKYKSNELNLTLSKEKIEKFKNSTKTIIKKKFTQLSFLNNPKIDGDTQSYFIIGERAIMSKNVFIDNADVEQANFDTFMAETLSKKIENEVYTTFLLKKSKNFIFKPENIFQAIQNLRVDERHMIICIGVNMEHYHENYMIENLNKDKFNKTPIIKLEASNDISNVFIVLRKDDLPKIIHKEIKPEVIEKYSLQSLSNDIKLYASVIDLNTASEDIIKECKHIKEEEELKKNVLLNIFLSTEIKWKKKIELIQINEYSENLHKDQLNEISEVAPFRNDVT